MLIIEGNQIYILHIRPIYSGLYCHRALCIMDPVRWNSYRRTVDYIMDATFIIQHTSYKNFILKKMSLNVIQICQIQGSYYLQLLEFHTTCIPSIPHNSLKRWISAKKTQQTLVKFGKYFLHFLWTLNFLKPWLFLENPMIFFLEHWEHCKYARG